MIRGLLGRLRRWLSDEPRVVDVRAKRRAYYRANRERIIAQAKAWKRTNRERDNLLKRRRYHRKKAARMRSRAYYAKHREDRQARQRHYRVAHLELVRAKDRARTQMPERRQQIKLSMRRYRARLRAAGVPYGRAKAQLPA